MKSSMHGDVLKVVEETDRFVSEAFPERSFTRLFWEEQKKAASCKSANGMRWHPLIIRWALSMKMASSSAYHIMRTCGMIRLPSERTLRDYTHFFKQTAGFNSGSNHQLVSEARLAECSDVQKHVTLVFHEMKIRDDLVYHKHDQEIVGFVDLGSVDNELQLLENSAGRKQPVARLCPAVATHILVLMVRGIATSLRFPWAHFPTTGVGSVVGKVVNLRSTVLHSANIQLLYPTIQPLYRPYTTLH